MLPFTAGARPGKRNMMSLPNSANSRLFPERKPSPTPTSSSNDPTPQAIPNMVRNERSLCAQRLRKICAKMSKTVRIIERQLYLFNISHAVLEGPSGGALKTQRRLFHEQQPMRYRGSENIGVEQHYYSDEGTEGHRVPRHKPENDSFVAHLLGGGGSNRDGLRV